ncbi:glycosyltransferase family 2 protein [Paludibacter sp. 221]|uniref:glycosyltransferase family 2 protein n=1 Tax=Paludibacter sp. 221 TaxID=2302939 RepID=UPI0013D3215B|nr:glycosyltransferase family 2 protein [Paludibacter sp. 221]NDV45636.1 glycosyltransferase family 2 protein [Paludibacter sp. 221]
MKVAIVILNWNGAQYLKQFLPVLIKNTKIEGVEIFVADNGSTDDSLSVLEKDFPTVNVITLDQNYGYAEGYNKALFRVEDAEYFLLLNSDVEVAKGWLHPLVEYMDKNEDVAACQPKICSYQDKENFEYAGAAGGFIDSLGMPFCRGRVLRTIEKDEGQYDDIIDIFWATGACFMIRAGKFWDTDGFDGSFFAHMEEIDLCWRLRSRGQRIVCIPQSKVYHVGGGTLSTESPYKTYLNYRNNLLMLYKNLPENSLRKTMFIRYFFDYLAALHLFLTGRIANAFKIFVARRHYKKLRGKYDDKRRENIQHSAVLNIPEILPRSIVLQYYFKGKNTYNKLWRK